TAGSCIGIVPVFGWRSTSGLCDAHRPPSSFLPSNKSLNMTNLITEAKTLAQQAHAGQTDKAGRPYIEHVARVAAQVAFWPEAEAVAWLHDVVEDHPDYNR